MTTNFHTAITTGAVANASTINSPLGELDAQLTATQGEVTAARSGYSTLDGRLDALVLAGGNVATLANGAASAGQKVVTVDSSTGFIAGAYVAYLLAGGALEYNTIDTVDSPTQITLDTNIGTGGIADNAYISMISPSEYQAANAINHSGDLTLPDAMEYAAGDIYNVLAYGAVADEPGDGSGTDNSTAIQAAITAAGSGIVYLPPGAYKLTTSLDLTSLASGITIRGDARESTVLYWYGEGGNVLDLTGSQYVKIENISITAGNVSDAGANYYADTGILMGRKAGAGSAGNHVLRDIHLNNYFAKAAIYSLSSEVNHLDNVHIYSRDSYCYYHSDANDLSAASDYETLTALAGNATTTTILGGSWCNWSPDGGCLAYIKNTTGLTISGLGLQTDSTPAVGAITFDGTVQSAVLSGIRQEGTPDYGIHIKNNASVLSNVMILGCYFTGDTAGIYGDNGTTMQYCTILGTFNTGAAEQFSVATMTGCIVDTLGLTATIRTAGGGNTFYNATSLAEPDITGGTGNIRYTQWSPGSQRYIEFSGGVWGSDLGFGIKASAASAATTPGNVTKKIAVYDEAGNTLGYVAIYDAIT